MGAWICTERGCELDFDTIEEMEKHRSSVHTGVGVRVTKAGEQPKISPTAPQIPTKPVPIKQDKPLKLTYKYEGTCGKCKTPVTTLLVKLDGRTREMAAIAFCLMCSTQLLIKEVKDLDKGK